MPVRMQIRSPTSRELSWTLIIGPLLAAAILAMVQFERLSPTYSAALSADFGRIEAVSFVGGGANEGAEESVPPVKIIEQATALFGMDTEPVTQGEIPKKWEHAMAGIARELQIVERCRASNVCPAAARPLIDLSSEGAGQGDRVRVGLINRAADLAIRPVSDEVQWRVPDHWSTPFETLQSGQGDCEDYAIVKYLVLLRAGISGDDGRRVALEEVVELAPGDVVLVQREDGGAALV